MSPIRILLVDDEYLALNLLENYAAQIPDLVVVDKVKLPLKALEIIQTQEVDIVFLDIQMPVLSGNSLVKILPSPAPLVVFTTAYSDYAIEAFNLNVVDYLLKPFTFERFLQAIQKARDILQAKTVHTYPLPIPSHPLPESLTVKANGKMIRIRTESILFVEGMKEYVRFHCLNNQKHIVLESLKNLEEQLPPPHFVRVHKSFLVAKNKVNALDGNMLEIGATKIPVSRDKKEDIMKSIFGV